MSDERIPLAENPTRLRCIVLPPEGLTVRFATGDEMYLRSCPDCGGRLEVSISSGRLPEWYCPRSRAGQCGWAGEAVAKMSMALAEDMADVRMPTTCHECGGADVLVEIHRRANRVEVVSRHAVGHACPAQAVCIFHTFSTRKEIVQQWDKDPGKFEKKDLDDLPTWTPDEATKKIEQSRFGGETTDPHK